MNFLINLIAALIPLVVGFIWYNPKVLGRSWMESTGMTEEKAKGANMPLIFGLSYVFNVLVALGLQMMVIHQLHLYSLFFGEPIDDPTTESGALFKTVMDKFGSGHRTFGHGAFHGILTGILLALPIIGTNALFERKGFKYVAINTGYWIISMALMGGVIAAFSK